MAIAHCWLTWTIVRKEHGSPGSAYVDMRRDMTQHEQSRRLMSTIAGAEASLWYCRFS